MTEEVEAVEVKLIASPEFRMPGAALRRLPPGDYRCTVRIHIDPRGFPEATTIRSCDPMFQDTAAEDAMKVRFAPPKDADGNPTEADFDLRITYRVKERPPPPPGTQGSLRLGARAAHVFAPPPVPGTGVREDSLLGELGWAAEVGSISVLAGTRAGGFEADLALALRTGSTPAALLLGLRVGAVGPTPRERAYFAVGAELGPSYQGDWGGAAALTLVPELDITPHGVDGRLMLSLALAMDPWR